jgi:hypothetical protein
MKITIDNIPPEKVNVIVHLLNDVLSNVSAGSKIEVSKPIHNIQIKNIKEKMSFGNWKFSQGLRYMSDFTYKDAKGQLFDVDAVNNAYNDYYNI